MLTVRLATLDDIDAVAGLFDQYRQFYQQAADAARARAFIAARLANGESTILVAEHAQASVGFTQLFPSFSSVQAQRVWILNDLFVHPDARRLGIARRLLEAAAEFARRDGAFRLELETDHDNQAAQALYRALGWQAYDGTLRFRLPLA